ncbi:hypothetical protein SAMN05216223_125114 [Actinacidiphila yanglinensis]|uniref:Uncharacterized protein n=1 Tax=Actinacidiphila yanglinensis TaxID=310779 RepID=A0A1H6E3Y1_9ACTN|nr:hypothetical protein [Actinacidiphila yanglinensis]SEG92277.1 hypothetical protein SAMN05216223_125114 [Actinacidiphila yanglinensis]
MPAAPMPPGPSSRRPSDPDPDTRRAWPVVVWDKADRHRYAMVAVPFLSRARTAHDPFLTALIAPQPGHPLWNPGH